MTVTDPFEVALDLLVAPDREPWADWLRSLFPSYFTAPFAPHQETFWAWVWDLRENDRPDPQVNIWPRGGAKSTSAEIAVVAMGAHRVRRYFLYVCGTQEQADDHVQNIGTLLESREFGQRYPQMSDRLVGKYGTSKGWRRNRLRTASGFTVDAIGLDTAARGVKIEDQRPDGMVIDDIDDQNDTSAAVDKKIRTLTQGLLPAGTANLAVLAVQNLVHEHSVFAKLADGSADFLATRHVSGPIPALRDMVYERTPEGKYVITGGTPTWEGQGLAACQTFVDLWGITSFRKEAQHEVEPPPGGMFDHLDYRHVEWQNVPWETITRRSVWVDPAVTDNDASDSMGIQADALAADGTIYRLWSWEQRTSPLDAICRAIRKADELGSATVGIETDQGGDTWQSVYAQAVKQVREGLDDLAALGEEWIAPAFVWDKAGAGKGPKVHRASQMLADYERGRFVHVIGTHQVLERGLRRFPKTKPLDLVDAAFWSWRYLRGNQGAAFLEAWGQEAAERARAVPPPEPAAPIPATATTTQAPLAFRPHGRRA